MSLDKQRILSELGSVINQLQSADCGCMGKLFGNNQGGDGMGMGMGMGMNNPMQQGDHGHGAWCHHNNFQGNGMAGNMGGMPQGNMNNRMCMGNCNPPKLYADTYNYLNHNLMQPTMNEVYNDLKSISPENTVMNNPLGTQMGLSNQGNMGSMAQGNMGGMPQANMGSMPQGGMDSMGQDIMAQGNMSNMERVPQGNMGGSPMAYNVSANQDSSGMASNPMQNSQHMGQFNGMGQKILDMMMSSNKNNSSRPTYQMGDNGAVNSQPGQGQNMMDVNPQVSQQSPNAFQNQSQPQTYTAPNMQHFSQNQYRNMNSEPGAVTNANASNAQNPSMMSNQMHKQPMNAIANKTEGNQPNYGMHSMGMAKFNEMFPGVKGVNGNLEFDPMAIAIQMNPANQKQSAMKHMQDALMGNKGMQNVYKNINEGTNKSANQNTNQVPADSNTTQQVAPQTRQENAVVPNTTTENTQQNIQGTDNVNQPHQAIQQIDPNIKNPVVGQHLTETANPVTRNPAHTPGINNQQANQDPKSQTFKTYEYNTLGQPVDMLPVDAYRLDHMTNAPQGYPATVNPRPSNVRSSPSKTSLLGKVGRTQSRIQLQRIYNQYKGAQSNSLQNIAMTGQPLANQVAAPPIERMGGDAIHANQAQIENDQEVDKGGDANNMPQKHTDIVNDNFQSSKGRNGLQDMTFTAYPLTTAWTFHGDRGSPRFQNPMMRV